MSKSYRYDPDAEEPSRPSWERRDDATSLGEVWPDGEDAARPVRVRRRKAELVCGPATPERAMEMMKDRIDTVLSTLEKRRIFAPHEKEDYAQILNIHICRMLPFYDSGRRGWNDRTASLLRYLNVCVDSAVANIVKHCMTRKCNVFNNAMPVLEACDDEDDDDGAPAILPFSDNPFRDPRRYLEELCLRMDVEVLFGMLTEEERIALDMRIQGYTFPEIADEINDRLHLGVDRFHVMNVTMEGVRRAARKCGFEPPSGCRGGGGGNS